MPIEDLQLHAQLRSVLEVSLRDDRQTWDLSSDGSYTRRMPTDETALSAHRRFMHDPWGMTVEGKPTIKSKHKHKRFKGHARTEGKGRTDPAHD